jgi:GntR family transcriptional repressor for pyruvate dehydrogenase complex
VATPDRNGAPTTESDGRPPDPRLAAFRPIRLLKAADEVIAVIADALRAGLYVPGDQLPRQPDLADRLGVSLNVLREAIEALRRAGVVSVRRGHSGGVVVVSTVNLPQVLAAIKGETQSSLRSVLQARRAIELAAAPLAAELATADDVARLRSLVDDLGALLGAPDAFMETDVRFHFAVTEISGNLLLNQFYSEMWDALARTVEHFPSGRLDSRAAEVQLHQQRKSLKAIESRDRRKVIRAFDEHLGTLEVAILGAKLPFP